MPLAGPGDADGYLAGTPAYMAPEQLTGEVTVATDVYGIGTGYIGCACLNALAFVIMGSLFAGRLYLLAVAWGAAAVAMGALLPYAPLIYAGLMAACSLTTGLQLKAFLSDDPAPAPRGNGA